MHVRSFFKTYSMLKNFLFIFIIGFSFLESSQPLSFSELIDIGLENHPKTKVAWWNAKRSAAIVGVAKSAYYPDLYINTNAVHGRDFKYVNGPDTNFTIVQADLALSMLLYDFGERDADVCSAKMALLAAQWDIDFTMQKVMIGILESAYLLAYEEEVLASTSASLKDADMMLDVAENLFQSGLNPVSDVYIARSARALMRIELAKRKSLVDIQRGKLATSLGLPIETPVQLAPFEVPTNSEKIKLDQLLLLAENHRADLMRKRARVAEAAFFREKIQSKYKPKLSLGAKGGYDHAFGDGANGAHYQILLNFDVPLFNGFSNSYENKAAYADVRIEEEDAADLELDIALDVLTFSKSVEASEEMLFYADENLQSAKKAYEGTLDKYQIGEESIIELNTAQKQLAEARVIYSEIKSRLLVSIANLAYATGTLHPSMEPPCIK